MKNITVNFNIPKISKMVKKHIGMAQVILDTQVLKDSNYYIPKDTGNLESSGVRATKPGTGEITWDTVYARNLYYNPAFNFSKDSNPNARGKWFENAKARRKKEWLKAAQSGYNKRD